VRDALANPAREKRRLILTPNAAERLRDASPSAGIEPEIAEPRRFSAPLDPGSVHQGAALEAEPLDWGDIETSARRMPRTPPPSSCCSTA
jgi:23S rRNA (guanosine2251-2'-O)-methyltransferase